MTPVADQIFFDEQDASLFLVDDARLRADALKHSLVSRLRRVMNAAIAGIRDIYGIEVLDDSIAKAPSCAISLYTQATDCSHAGAWEQSNTTRLKECPSGALVC